VNGEALAQWELLCQKQTNKQIMKSELLWATAETVQYCNILKHFGCFVMVKFCKYIRHMAKHWNAYLISKYLLHKGSALLQ
jgi:hypothetical protein